MGEVVGRVDVLDRCPSNRTFELEGLRQSMWQAEGGVSDWIAEVRAARDPQGVRGHIHKMITTRVTTAAMMMAVGQ